MSYNKNNNQKFGFSLIELSIVFIVISVLMLVVVKGSYLIGQTKIASARQKTANSPVLKIDGLTIWFETTLASSFLESEINDGRSITVWNNISDSNPKISNNGSGNATYISNGINDLPVLRFNGSSNFFTFNGDSLTNNNYTIFLVATRRSSQDTNMILGGTSVANYSNLNVGYFLNGTPRFRVSHLNDGTPATDLIDSTVSDYKSPSFEIHSITFDSAVGKKYYRNGSQKDSVVTSPAKTYLASWPGASIGRFNNSFFNGDIAEIIIFNRSLKDQERKDIERYLSDKYQINVL